MANKKTKIDDGAYANFATGMGRQGFDKTEETRASAYTGAKVLELARMAVQDGVADSVVTVVPEAAFAQDVNIVGDEKGELLDHADEMGLFDALETAGEMQRLSGGALVFTDYDDAITVEDLEEPVQPGVEINGYRVYSAGSVEINKADFDGDDPRRFTITKIDGSRVIVDASRVTVIHGKPLPQELSTVDFKEAYFGTSALKKCESSIKRYADVMGAVATMASETGAKIFKLENFNELLSRPETGIRDARELINLVGYSMSANRSAFMGANDNVTFMSHNFGGLPDIIRECRAKICADCKIPETILFGRTATGLGQSNDADIKAFAEMAHKWRKRYIYRPAMKLIADLASRNMGLDINGSFIWGDIDVMSEKEKIDARAKQAQTLNTYYQMGVISAEEIRNGVFVNGHSFEIALKND